MSDKKVKTALLRSHFDMTESDEIKLQQLAMNTGNMVFWKSLDRLFKPEIVSYSEIEKLKNFDNVIITDLIWIRENADFEYLEKIFDQVNIPFIPISVGLQSATFNPDFKLSESTVRLLKKIEQRAVLGVRGYYTASILEKYGITNFSVIGCPSMYYWNNPNLKINEKKQPKNVSSNFKTFYQPLSRLEKHFLSYCADHKMQFIEQTKHKLKPEITNDQAYFNYVNNWLTSKSEMFYDYESWSEGLKGIDFSFGGRFHGNVIALHNNIKSLFLTSDSRTEEMTDFFKLPTIHMSKFDRDKSIKYYFDKADYSQFNAQYPLVFANFMEFVKKNGLEIDEGATPLEFNPVKENKKEIDVQPAKELKSINYSNCNKIYIKPIINKNRIDYSISVEGSWDKCFFTDHEFFVEYDCGIETCPNSIAIIPLLSTILPVAWLENATVIVDELDEDFYECLDTVKDNYKFMIPQLDFRGKLIVKQVVRNKVNYAKNNTICLYSGGVDATSTMLHNIDYKPTILTIWGTDMYMEDTVAWEKVKKENQETADKFKIPFSYLKSSFRDLLNESYLTQMYGSVVRGNWWHDFQHGIALLGLVAPYAYMNDFCNVKIASSYSAKDREKVVCASVPFIDENVKFCGCTIYHDGFYMSRMDKVKQILRYAEKNNCKFKLRVCLQEITGENCCLCEKCARTLFAVIANCCDPANFGFNITPEIENKLLSMIESKQLGNNIFWDETKLLIRKNKEQLKENKLAMKLIEMFD